MSRLRNRGFSLVEIMVGLFIGALLVLVVGSAIADISGARHESERTNRQVANARYAMQLLADDIANAGYWGEYDSAELSGPAALPDPCATAASDLTTAVAVPVQGYVVEADKPGCLNDVRPGTAAVVIRRASTCVAGAAGCDPAGVGETYLQASLCQTELASGYVSAHYAVAAQVGTGASPFLLTQRDCVTPAVLRKYVSRVYYVAANNQPGDGIPTLKRAELLGGAIVVTPLVDGIEDLRIEYGIDTNGDGAPEAVTVDPATYGGCAADACAVANWRNVVTATIYVLARTTEPSAGQTDAKTYRLAGATVGPFGDRFRRHVYVQSVRLNNVAGRRE